MLFEPTRPECKPPLAVPQCCLLSMCFSTSDREAASVSSAERPLCGRSRSGNPPAMMGEADLKSGSLRCLSAEIFNLPIGTNQKFATSVARDPSRDGDEVNYASL